MEDQVEAGPEPDGGAERRAPPAPPGRPFAAGDPVEILSARDRSFVLVLKAGKRLNLHGHRFEHDDIIGRPEGSAVISSLGKAFPVVRPTLASWTLKMPRFATPTYPKDVGAILVHADLFPGARVLEAGIGSGALALHLLRAVGPGGAVISYETRPEAVERAARNLDAWLGPDRPTHVVRERDVYEAIDEEPLDRVVLDVPEPWRVVPHAARVLKGGGIWVCYLPTVLQVHEAVGAIRQSMAFAAIQTLEVLQRGWRVSKRSVRPEQQMVGHTGFLTFARRVEREPTD